MEESRVPDDLIYRLRKRAEIRRQIPNRKSVQEGAPDRIADILEEAASRLQALEEENKRIKEAIKSVLWVDECRCDEAYTKRGRHEPNTYCGELDPLREALRGEEGER